MTGSGSGSGSGRLPHLGVLLLAAVLLQTVSVTVTVLYFSSALSSVRKRHWKFLTYLKKRFREERGYPAPRTVPVPSYPPRSRLPFVVGTGKRGPNARAMRVLLYTLQIYAFNN